jgi:hypothetical protein
VVKMVVCAAAGTDSDRPTSSAAIEAVAFKDVLTMFPPVSADVLTNRFKG